jgi:hypothetical protein
MLSLSVFTSVALIAHTAHAVDLPPPPAPLTIAAAELTELGEREVVVRYPGPGKETTAIIDIAAPVAAVMTAVLDLPPRESEIGGIKSLDVYEQSPGQMSARWEVGLAFISAVFHIDYRFDVAQGWCVYALDTTKENTIESTQGSYQVYATDGGSRMIYRSLSVGSSGTPDWIRKKLAYSSARELLSGIRSRAEAQ